MAFFSEVLLMYLERYVNPDINGEKIRQFGLKLKFLQHFK
jgi:hypothetical protein